jgi:hypothetical protein
VCVLAGSDVERLKPNLARLHDLRLLRLKPDEIANITVTHGDETYALDRAGEHWTGSGALGAPDEPTVAGMVQTLTGLRATDFYPQPTDLAQYGLDRPTATLTVRATDPNLPPCVIRFGVAPVTGVNAYAQLADQPSVYVLSAGVLNTVAPAALMLAARDLLKLEVARVERFVRRDATGTVEMAREAAGWHCLQPAGQLASGPGVDGLLRDLSGLRAARVVARGGDAQYGLDQPALTLQVLLKPEPNAPPATLTTAPAVPATAPASATAPTSGSATTAPAWTHTLRVSFKDAVPYCRVDDDPFIYELDPTVYTTLTGELTVAP